MFLRMNNIITSIPSIMAKFLLPNPVKMYLVLLSELVSVPL